MAPTARCQLSFTDGNFLDSSWQLTTFVSDVGAGSASWIRIGSGGNPGAMRQINTVAAVVSENVPSGTFASSTLNGAVFDPNLFTTAVSLDFSIEYTHIATNSTGGGSGEGHGVRFLVVQNGRHYVTSTSETTGQGTAWGTFSVSGLDAADFIEVDPSLPTLLNPSSHPDFAPGAAPVLLGFNVASSTGVEAAGFTEDITTGYDNFSVQVNGTSRASQPGSLTWLGSSGALPETLGWTLNTNASPEVPTLSGGILTLETDTASEIMSYGMGEEQLLFPANTVIEFSMRVVSSTANFPQRRGVSVGVAVAENVLINLWIGEDDVRFTNAADVVVDSDSSLDTDDAFHDYRLEIDGTASGAPVRLYQDEVLVLEATMTLANSPGLLTPPRINFGETTGAETGTSEWTRFTHNAHRAQGITRTLISEHGGLNNPTAEGFVNTDPGVGVSEGPLANDLGSGFDAWFIDDNSTLGGSAIVYRSPEFDPGTMDLAQRYGWSLITRCRIPEGSTGVFRAMTASVFPGPRGFGMLFDRESDGDPSIVLDTGGGVGPELVIEGAGDQTYIYYELKFDPITQTADFFADGVLYYSGYTGFSSTLPKRVNWGANASNGTGRGHFSVVAWAINTSPRLRLEPAGNALELQYIGVLQESDDLGVNDPWSDVTPQPPSPWSLVPNGSRKFYRIKR